jgi:hypothetical protein
LNDLTKPEGMLWCTACGRRYDSLMGVSRWA